MNIETVLSVLEMLESACRNECKELKKQGEPWQDMRDIANEIGRTYNIIDEKYLQ